MSQSGRGFLPWVLLGIGMVLALVVGLMSPWRLCPWDQERPETAALSEFLRQHYIVWVSDSYAANGDLDQARERLSALEEEDVAIYVADMAVRYMENSEDVGTTRRLIALAQALEVGDEGMAEYMIATAPTPTPTETAIPAPTPTETPAPTATSTPVPTPTNTPLPPAPATATPTLTPAHPTPVPREIDRRLDLFLYPMVRMEEAQVGSGQWYWRLIRTVWQDQWEAGGRHHIYVEVLDENGNRAFGQTVVIEYGGGPHYEPYPDTEKLGEEYAFNFIMHAPLGAYNVYIDGLPSDKIYGLGLGTIQNPQMNYHTSFLLTFQRTYQP